MVSRFGVCFWCIHRTWTHAQRMPQTQYFSHSSGRPGCGGAVQGGQRRRVRNFASLSADDTRPTLMECRSESEDIYWLEMKCCYHRSRLWWCVIKSLTQMVVWGAVSITLIVFWTLLHLTRERLEEQMKVLILAAIRSRHSDNECTNRINHVSLIPPIQRTLYSRKTTFQSVKDTQSLQIERPRASDINYHKKENVNLHFWIMSRTKTKFSTILSGLAVLSKRQQQAPGERHFTPSEMNLSWHFWNVN